MFAFVILLLEHRRNRKKMVKQESVKKALQVKVWSADQLYNGDKNVITLQQIGLPTGNVNGLSFLEILNVRNIHTKIFQSLEKYIFNINSEW